MKFWLFSLLFLHLSLQAAFSPDVKGKILYFIHKNETEKALTLYLEHAKKTSSHDYELLQEAGLRLLERGAKSSNPEDVVMCMFGAGISLNPQTIAILQKGMQSDELKTQAVALNYLANMQDDEANDIIFDALSSPSLITRLEAALILAEKKDATVVEQMESLFYKVPEEVRVVFAQIVSPIETPAATAFLQKLLNDPNAAVRCSAIQEIGKSGHDDLLPLLRKLAAFPNNMTQEAAVNACALLKDEESKELFISLSQKKGDYLKLVALKGLYQLGQIEALSEIQNQATAKNLYAISLLGSCDKSSAEVLAKLLEDSDPTVRLNAAFALLQLGDKRACLHLKPLLIRESKGTVYTQISSPGRALYYWKEVPKSQGFEEEELLLREKLLLLTLELPESEFLTLAKMIFDYNQNDLVPVVVELLINHASEKAIDLLKQMAQKTGAPLIRNYCNVALLKLDVEGPYEQNLIDWVKDEKNHPLIRFREEKKKMLYSRFELNPEAKSQLLVLAFETLASKRNEKGLYALINALASGNAQNKYALAGLLMRTTE